MFISVLTVAAVSVIGNVLSLYFDLCHCPCLCSHALCDDDDLTCRMRALHVVLCDLLYVLACPACVVPFAELCLVLSLAL